MDKADCICELKQIRGVYAGMRKEYRNCVDALGMAINALEQTTWIPCSERLSEKAVLCCDDRGDMIIGYPYADRDSDTGFSAELDDIFLLNCIAWMPLPMPYEGGTE